jgi:hypothetical protein
MSLFCDIGRERVNEEAKERPQNLITSKNKEMKNAKSPVLFPHYLAAQGIPKDNVIFTGYFWF